MTLAEAEHRAGSGASVARVEPEDELRAHFYGALARLLERPADRQLLSQISAFKGNGTPLGRAIDRLAGLARAARADDVEAEYGDLFIGLGRGELVPNGSYYLTGFMHEKPLARLRRDMAVLGAERDPAVREPEDHIAILCETMAGLILGRFGRPAGLAEQRAFFAAHIGSWAGHFFRDLETAKAARLYAGVGAVGRELMAIEEQAFALVAGGDGQARNGQD